MDRMVFPIEEPDVEMLVHDYLSDLDDWTSHLLGIRFLDAVDAVLAPLYKDAGIAMMACVDVDVAGGA
ncbi:hypothetical protein [Rhodococcus sp. USK13]|uniref:hypothetical protein n=1 Tax=Rhodococcus sp. USK13 TaxID=2806442 RepID=UPI001BCE59D7|nr:hypothetical protein [Rhodococcus sp. USK13]